jgi:hypothetical protein
MNGMNDHNHMGTAPVVLQHDDNYSGHRQITTSTTMVGARDRTGTGEVMNGSAGELETHRISSR